MSYNQSSTSKLFRAALQASLVTASLAVIAPMIAQAQETKLEDVDNSKFHAVGIVNANSVYVRSGPSDNDYPVLKLDKDAQLTVVGRRFEWLKVLPPSGTYCLVAKAYVEKHGDGSQGTVTNTLYVRIGTTLNAMKTKVAMKLEPGEEVRILGEQEEYFKIVPPQGVFLYVNMTFVTPTKVADGATDGGKVIASDPVPTPPTTTPPPAPPVANAGGNGDSKFRDNSSPPATGPVDTTGVALTPTTEPSVEPSAEPSTQPMATADAETQFARLETSYTETMTKPLDEQDLPTLHAGYAKLAKPGTTLPESMRRVAETKASLLASREKDREEFIAVKKRQAEIAQRQVALRAESEELEQRVAKNDVKYFTAVGVLRPSSLQQGTGTLFRLTDPSTGRTVVYVRSLDNKIGSALGQFIGVKGELVDDTQLGLRTVTPTSFEPCDSSKLFTRVTAQIVPPSLMPAGTTAGAN